MGFLWELLGFQSPTEALWAWFIDHEHDLVSLAQEDEALPQEDQEDIQKLFEEVNPHLGFSLLKPALGNRWRLAITVGGKPDMLPLVEEVMAKAPRFRYLDAVAYMPPMDIEGLEYPEHGLRLAVKDLFFRAENGALPQISILVPQLTTNPGMHQLALMVLYNYLGEYQYGRLLAYLKLLAAEGANTHGLRPLHELRKALRAFTQE